MKKITKSIIFLLILLLLTISANAVVDEFWACFNEGQIIRYCNGNINENLCGNRDGCPCKYSSGCEVCVDGYNATRECYSSGDYNNCVKSIERECSMFDGGEISQDPAEITISSPIEGKEYTERYALLDLDITQVADVYYLDNINGRGMWTRVCTGCSSYSRNRAFKEGLNDLTFRVKNKFGLYTYKDLSFYIDSKVPRISKTLPKKGFADGTFIVEFKEENPEEVIIHYGNSAGGYNELGIEIEEGCTYYRGKYSCELKDLDLSQYNNQQIEYWAVVKDIVDNEAISKIILLNVDTTLPEINNEEVYQIEGRYINFLLDITEANFKDIQYIDYSLSSPRWQSLCTSLREGFCSKRKSFALGNHVLDIKVTDKAGNKIIKSIEFDII